MPRWPRQRRGFPLLAGLRSIVRDSRWLVSILQPSNEALPRVTPSYEQVVVPPVDPNDKRAVAASGMDRLEDTGARLHNRFAGLHVA